LRKLLTQIVFLEIQVNMLNKGLLKLTTHSIIGITLLTSVDSVLPNVCLAEQLALAADKVSTDKISTEYTLGEGDRIRVNVFEVPEYTGEYQIPPGGAVNLPLIGSIKVLGLTADQAADQIAKKYARFLKRPLVSINLITPRPINVFVAGEVTRPGAYTLSLQGGGTAGPTTQYPSLLAALTTAQGVTLSADISKVELHRKIGLSSEQVILFNLKELTQTGKTSEDMTLRDGDTIVVPTATQFNIAESRNLFSTTFAASQSTPRTVVVIGEVVRPGSYLVTSGTGDATGGAGSGLPSVMRTIQLAGGITSQADIRHLKLRRPTRTGTEQNIDINLWQLFSTGDINQDVIVQDGDTIVVPKATAITPAEATEIASTTLSPAKISVGVVGEVKRPGVTDLKPNSSLNQALLAAGGFNDDRASRATVDLIRLNPNGTVTKRPVKVDFSQGINDQTNPILENNDVIVVSRSGLAKAGDGLTILTNPIGTIVNLLRLFGL